MSDSHQRPRWASRVRRHEIARLYLSDAKGLHDEEFADQVGTAFYARIQDILVCTEAHRGRATCPECGSIIQRKPAKLRKDARNELLQCPGCDWELSWDDYFRSYRKKHLLAGGMETYFREFIKSWPGARGYGEKIVLIDTLIHRFHWELEGEPGGPGAVGLIGGTRSEIFAFLNELTYGDHSTPGLAARRHEWRSKLGWAGWTEATVDELTAKHRWPGREHLEDEEADKDSE